jgi:uncharacterized protein YceK
MRLTVLFLVLVLFLAGCGSEIQAEPGSLQEIQPHRGPMVRPDFYNASTASKEAAES